MAPPRRIKSDLFSNFQIRRKQSRSHSSAEQVKQLNIKLPGLTEVTKDSRESLFVRKLQLCSVTYDFLEATYNEEKRMKSSTLKELAVFTTEDGNVKMLTESTYKRIISMVSENIFRSLPPKDRVNCEPEYWQLVVEAAWCEPEYQQLEEAAWPHLKLVYDFFLHFLVSPELNLAFLKSAIDKRFTSRLIETFDTEDARERQCLKSVLFTIYQKIIEMRVTIRKQIENVFLSYVYEAEEFNGIKELLEILCTCINGFQKPLRREHVEYLNRVLIPLHKPKNLVLYQEALIDCLKGYVSKDEGTVTAIVDGLVKFWPITSTEKQILFLQEIVELSEVMSNFQFRNIHEPLMKKVATCLSSPHYQVAEAAINLWNDVGFYSLAKNNLKTILPIVLPELHRAAESHWFGEVSEAATELLRVFSQEDPSHFLFLGRK